MNEIIKKIGIAVKKANTVSGGDINKAFFIEATDGSQYFLKRNSATLYPCMFEKEANGLKSLAQYTNLAIPEVLQSGSAGTDQFLLLKWIEKTTPAKDFWINFGNELAQMHKKPQLYFGLQEDNYIGSLPQINSQSDTWSEFYTDCRIMPLVKKLRDNGSFSEKDIKAAEGFCKQIDQIFPAEPPSLLHGDLWSGNFMVGANGYAAIYDPAVYFGHREMDIGMTKLFGGFFQQFYDSYIEAYPLESNWQSRLRYSQLYPLLVHAILFGGHYVSSSREILNNFF